MAEVPTVEVHSPKDASKKWIINQDDYTPEKYRLWGDPDPSMSINSDGNELTQLGLDHALVNAVDTAESETESSVVLAAIVERQPSTPSHPDFVSDSDGNIVGVNIIDPDRRTSRKEIPVAEYDPDSHELWSTHPRFNR